MMNLTDWEAAIDNDPVPLIEPVPLDRDQWPPDYDSIYRWRHAMLLKLRRSRIMQASARAYYSTRPKHFIMHWMDTYDPRRNGNKWIPFVFFKRQADFIDFLHELRQDQESGLCEKARDMGVTWLSCAYSVWCWLFINNDAIGWGSRKEDLVDKIGDADSVFEKMRLIIDRLPPFWLPEGYVAKKHATFMKLINPQNGSIITGEAGDGIGRGGRKSIFIKDESAHYERAEKIEAALGDNTNVQVDISSVNGLGNVFHRRRENGIDWQPANKRAASLPKGFVRVFVMDWHDHPAKTQQWYDTRKAKYDREGMGHIFAQEVDRNYSAAVSNTVIPYDWIQSAVDAHLKIPYLVNHIARHGIPDRWTGGLDVADMGSDKNALSLIQWIIWRECDEWGERDPGVSARRAIIACRPHAGSIECMYDSIGVGSGVKTEYNRLTQDERIIDPQQLPFVPWNAGAGVLNPYERIIPDDEKSLLNREFYANLKAQAWWALRGRFYKTHKAITEGAVYSVDELISLDSNMPLLSKLMKELAQPTRGQSGNLKALIEKQPDGMASPNLADSGVMAYFPVPNDYGEITVGVYGH